MNIRPLSMTGFFIVFFVALTTLTCQSFGASLSGGECQSLLASYYSVASLKAEGTYKYSKGVMANGQLFNERAYTCASCDYPIGSVLQISGNNKKVIVRVTDRTNKRFKGKRIDLSPVAFAKLDKLSKGLIKVSVTKIK